MHNIIFRAALVLALAGPSAAVAQWSPSATLDLGMGYGRMALGQAALSAARRMTENSDEAFAGPGEDQESESWKEPEFTAVFETDPEVTETVNQRFILFYGGDDPDDREVMARKVESGDYQEHFRTLMEERGLEPRLDDLVEVTAARYVVLWEIIHGRKVTPEQARAVRGQLRAQFADDFWMKRIGDEEKQELAETFVLHVAAADIAHAELVNRDDQELLPLYREGVQRQLLPDGPRLDRIVITDEGFMRE